MLKDIWEIVNGKIETKDGELVFDGWGLSAALIGKQTLRFASQSKESVACPLTVGVSARKT